MKQSILLVRRAYGLGGAELYNLNLAIEMLALGYRPIICTQQPELTQLARDAGVVVINPFWLHNQGVLAGSFGIKTWLKYAIVGPLVVLQYMYYILRYNIIGLFIQTRDDQILGTIASKLLGRRSVWADHGDLKIVLTTQDPWFTRLYRWSMSKADAVICVADAERKLVAKLLPSNLKDKLVVIHNGISRERFELAPKKANEDELIIGSTARVQPEKGVDYLIRAFAEALPKLPRHSQLLLAGVIDDPSFIELTKTLGIAERVTFLGGISNTEIPTFLARLDIYVFPSLGEVFPLSVLEAMMASRPVIATEVGGIPEVIAHGETGMLVPPADTSALSHAIIHVANDAVRDKLARAGHPRVRERNDFKRTVAEQIAPLLTGGIHD